jgi:hypothetical protein
MLITTEAVVAEIKDEKKQSTHPVQIWEWEE